MGLWSTTGREKSLDSRLRGNDHPGGATAGRDVIPAIAGIHSGALIALFPVMDLATLMAAKNPRISRISRTPGSFVACGSSG